FSEAHKIKEVQAQLLAGKPTEALALLDRIEDSIFHPDTKTELQALVHLVNGEPAPGEKLLAGLTRYSTQVDSRDFLDYFLDNARYRELKIYTDYLQAKGEDVQYYSILYRTALFEPGGTLALIDNLDVSRKKQYQKALRIIARAGEELKTGRINYIFDVNGKPLAAYDLKKKTTIPLVPGIDFDSFNAHFHNGLKYYILTLDRDIQEKVHALFTGYHGSFILLDLKDGGLVSAYSKSRSFPGVNAAFSESYAPASTIKILTLLAFLSAGKELSWPFNCPGKIDLERKTFYDWRAHGIIDSYSRALALSCNLVFARLGQEVGLPGLVSYLEQFYFNAPPFKDLFLEFKTGTVSRQVPGKFQLARLAVGLSGITVTTLHSALISALVAQDGSGYAPYLVKNMKNILEVSFYNHEARLLAVLKDNPAFPRVREGMQAVIESPEGTGRRARVEFVQVAAKTGTAGEIKTGYDAIITGFFPANRPRYAFAFILQQGGRAENEGAAFLKDFLISFFADPANKN
ncbi:MAG: hypothetical protein EHM12_13040, partial [Dehalococcoidia bacterium]